MNAVLTGYEAPPDRIHQNLRKKAVAEITACGRDACVPMGGGGGGCYYVAKAATRVQIMNHEAVELDSTNAYAVSVVHNTCSWGVGPVPCKHVLVARLEHLRLGKPREWRDAELSSIDDNECDFQSEQPIDMLRRAERARDADAASRESPGDVNADASTMLAAMTAIVDFTMDSLQSAVQALSLLVESPLDKDAAPADVSARKVALGHFTHLFATTRKTGDAAASITGTGVGAMRQQARRACATSTIEVLEDKARSRKMRVPVPALGVPGTAAYGTVVKFSGHAVARLRPKRRTLAISLVAATSDLSPASASVAQNPEPARKTSSGAGKRMRASSSSRDADSSPDSLSDSSAAGAAGSDTACIECYGVIKGRYFTCCSLNCATDWGSHEGEGLCSACTRSRPILDQDNRLCQGCDLASPCKCKVSLVGDSTQLCSGCTAICCAMCDD